MRENICKGRDREKVNLQDIYTAHVAQFPKNKQPNKKKT